MKPGVYGPLISGGCEIWFAEGYPSAGAAYEAVKAASFAGRLTQRETVIIQSWFIGEPMPLGHWSLRVYRLVAGSTLCPRCGGVGSVSGVE